MYNVHIMKVLSFVWDEDKERINIQKHGVDFNEAKTIFFNLPLEIFYDPDHSESEDRYIAFGISNLKRILLVVHIENTRGTEIRIISARKAAKKEVRDILGGTKNT